MANISFSEPFCGIIQNLVKVLPKSATMIYRKDGMSRISFSDGGMLVHVAAGEADFQFDGDSIGLASLAEFFKYSKAIGYPKTGKIEMTKEVSISGHTYEFVKFSGNRRTLRCRVIDRSYFDKTATKVPTSKENNPFQLVASVLLTPEKLKEVDEMRKLVTGCEHATLTCGDNAVNMAMRGKTGQQVDLMFGYPDVKINSEVATAAYANNVLRMFPMKYFGILYGLGCNFEMEMRFSPERNAMSLPAYGGCQGVGPDQIFVYVGCVESEAATIANIDLVR